MHKGGLGLDRDAAAELVVPGLTFAEGAPEDVFEIAEGFHFVVCVFPLFVDFFEFAVGFFFGHTGSNTLVTKLRRGGLR